MDEIELIVLTAAILQSGEAYGDSITAVNEAYQILEAARHIHQQRIPIAEQEKLKRSVDDLDLGVRATRILEEAGIKTIGELIARTYDDILLGIGAGRKTVNEIQEALVTQMGLSLKGSLVRRVG